MRVAIFASAYAPHVGGVEELTHQLAVAYASAGHHAVVATNRWPRDLPAEEQDGDVPVYRFAFRTPDVSAKAWLSYHATWRRVRDATVRMLRAERIDVVHVQCVSANGHFARLAAEKLGVPLIVTAQGELTMDATQVYERSAFINSVLQEAARAATTVTACSTATLDELLAYLPFDVADARVIPNGVSLDGAVTAPSSDDGFVFALGRHVHQKGFDLLLDAVARANVDRADPLRLVLAGEGPETSTLREQVEKLGLEEQVDLVGVKTRDEVAELMTRCSFFALPSRHEPFGIVNLEAMRAGKAVVAFDVGGVRDIVEDEVNGMLIPAGDTSALAKAMAALMDDRHRRERLGGSGREVVARYNWPRIADQYLAVYTEALARRA